MTSGQIRAYKWKLVNQLMRWSIFNSSKMTVTDKKICHSKMVDCGMTLLAGMLMGSFMRKTLFRVNLPFLEMILEKSLFKPRWVKSVFAYSIASVATYMSLGGILKEEYLVDLAL